MIYNPAQNRNRPFGSCIASFSSWNIFLRGAHETNFNSLISSPDLIINTKVLVIKIEFI